MYQGSLGNLDPKTGEIKYYPLDAKWNDVKVQLNFTGPAPRGRRQGVDQERRHPGHLPGRPEDRQLGEIPPDRPAAGRASMPASIR